MPDMPDHEKVTQTDPFHIAIIMDGNGRWAQRQGLPRREGHRAGVNNVRRIVEAAKKEDVRYLTLYAFSAENWNRPPDEVNLLMRLLRDFLEKRTQDLLKNEIRFQAVGDLESLPGEVQQAIQSALEKTAHFEKYTLTLALNYGSRQEIARAVRKLLEAGVEDPESLTYESLTPHFYTSGLPDPDLIIRTSGEFRLSNFLLLQSAYSEFYFSEKCWPEFDEEEFFRAVAHYRHRERRFGQTGEQIQRRIFSSLTGS